MGTEDKNMKKLSVTSTDTCEKSKKHTELVWIVIILASLVVLLVLFILGNLVLLQADKHYLSLRSVVTQYLKRDNHFSGDLWFAAEATLLGAFISAIPGTLCALWAMKQTDRLHKLENRYHRPMLELESTTVHFFRKSGYDCVLYKKGICSRQYWGINRVQEAGNDWYIEFEITFSIKNDITVQTILIDRVEIENPKDNTKCICLNFPKDIMDAWEKNKHKIWDFEGKTEPGHRNYTFSFGVDQMQSSDAETYEMLVNEFADFPERQEYDYRYLTMHIYFTVDYEFADEKNTKNVLSLELEAAKSKIEDFEVENATANGYFIYE